METEWLRHFGMVTGNRWLRHFENFEWKQRLRHFGMVTGNRWLRHFENFEWKQRLRHFGWLQETGASPFWDGYRKQRLRHFGIVTEKLQYFKNSFFEVLTKCGIRSKNGYRGKP